MHVLAKRAYFTPFTSPHLWQKFTHIVEEENILPSKHIKFAKLAIILVLIVLNIAVAAIIIHHFTNSPPQEFSGKFVQGEIYGHLYKT